MPDTSVVLDPGPNAGRKAPAFTPYEKDVISAWRAAMSGRGLRVEVFANLYGVLEEVLLISSFPDRQTLWVVHKTPEAAVAVRIWPGVADVVPTLPEALADIAARLDAEDGETVRPERAATVNRRIRRDARSQAGASPAPDPGTA